ncbi:hypothetical protein BVX99_02265, partial [bacterium F16]
MNVTTDDYQWFSPSTEPFDEKQRPTWWMRRSFELETVPDSLHLDIVCLGYYELYVNGRQAGAEPLAPSISTLSKRAFILHHEVTSLLKPGRNCIAIWASSGWYLPHQFTVHE